MQLTFLLIFLIGLPQPGKKEEKIVKLREYVTKGMTAYTDDDYQKAIEYFKNAFELDSTYAPLAYNIACCYSLLNNKDSAITWLERTIALGTYEFERDKDFDNIRETKEFKELVQKADTLLAQAKKKEWKPIIYTPEDYDTTKQYPLFIGLHGYGGSPTHFARSTARMLAEQGYICAIPYGNVVHGLTSFSWAKMIECEEVILKFIKEIESQYSIDTSRIILLGYSQGGSRAFSIGLRNPDVFKGIIAVAGTFDEEELKGHLEKLIGRDLSVFIMIGQKDRKKRIESNRRAKELLEKYGIRVHLDVYPGVGHAFPGEPEKEIKRALRFILSPEK